MVDVPLRVLGVEGVDHLVHPKHAQSCHVQDLGLPTLEQPGPVRSGDQPDLAGERADLIRAAAVETDAVLHHALAHGLLLHGFEGRGDHAGHRLHALREALLEELLEFGLQRRQVGLAHSLLRHHGTGDAGPRELLHRGEDLVTVGGARRPLARGHADLGDELPLEVDDLSDLLLRDLQALGHDLLGGRETATVEPFPRPLRGFPLDHEDVDLALVVLPPGNDDVERCEIELLVGRVDVPLAPDEAETNRRHGPVERQPGEGHGQAGRVDAGDVVGVRHIRRKHRHDDLDLVPVAVLEGRPKGPVDQPGGEDGGFAGPALATEEASGDLAGGVHPLLDVNGEREEVDPLTGIRGHACGQDLGLSQRDHGGPLCL